jgi:hypothetical protein
MTPQRTCAHCGAALPAHAAVCSFCATADPLTRGRAPALAATEMGAASDAPSMPAAQLFPGSLFGPYRLGRLLGRGGMGEVHEAEHVLDGRAVAIKLLHERLATTRDRARFLREGQLAAALSHPNSVYVFGSDEINGVPVITMELLPGGTLKDRVEDHGPMDTRSAVDAMLHVIDGLDAAQALGILHRDVKPSNCFVDLDGTVKIGDFGLSISTARRWENTLTEAGTIQGTPQYAAPEQLRGDPLDVRADIYAVGATLYYLLTSRPPFEAPSLPALIARVMSDPPPRARDAATSVPEDLDRIIAACLAKAPEGRPASYPALRDALRPLSSEMPVLASLPLRAAAGALDQVAILPVTGPVALGVHQGSVAMQAGVFAVQVLYFAVLEGVWGRSAGKRIVGLQVVRRSGTMRVGVGRAACRATLYTSAWHAWPLTVLLLEQTSGGRYSSIGAGLGLLLSVALLAGLFGLARPRTGSAAAHDVLSGTRVIERRRTTEDDLNITPLPEQPIAPRRSFGPYQAIGTLGRVADTDLLVGYDAVLHRRVWIREVPVDTPAVSPARRRLGRPGRLRWLSGRRDGEGGWDAFEARDGAPLHLVARTPPPWPAVKGWLLTLATEIQYGLAGGTMPALSTDRVWLTAGRGATLLDFDNEAPLGAAGSGDSRSAQRFLFETAHLALTGAPASAERRVDRPLPLPARDLLTRLADGGFEDFGDAHAAIRQLTDRPDGVSRRRRAASCLVSTLVWALLASGVTLTLALFDQIAGRVPVPSAIGQPPLLSVMSADVFGLVPRFMAALVTVCLLSAAGAFLTRGGVSLHLWGIAVTDLTGRHISRLHALWRAVVAASPLLGAAAVVLGAPLSGAYGVSVAAAGVGLWLCGVVYAVAVPDRGIQDRIAGTWLVPR